MSGASGRRRGAHALPRRPARRAGWSPPRPSNRLARGPGRIRDLTAAPTFPHAGGHCARPRYDGHQGVTALVGGAGTAPTDAVVIEPQRPPSAAPAVLWVHWLGEPATTNHTEFLADARALAARGVVSLLVDMPWSQPNWFESVRKPETDYDDVVAQVVTLRRALDCLSGCPGSTPPASRTSATTSVRWTARCCSPPTSAALRRADGADAGVLGMGSAGRAAGRPRRVRRADERLRPPALAARGHQRATLLQFANGDEYVVAVDRAGFPQRRSRHRPHPQALRRGSRAGRPGEPSPTAAPGC